MRCSEPAGEIVFAGLMPHAPVLIPEIGCGREREAASTVAAMRALAAGLIKLEPELLTVVSPHSPRRPSPFGIWQTQRIAGDFTRFRAPNVGVDLPNDHRFNRELTTNAHRDHLATWDITEPGLDHGACVPLWFLCEAGWTGATSVVGLNHPGQGGHQALGDAIRATVAQTNQRTAVIASGDMSHALQAGSPAGFHPLAASFDRSVVEVICSGHYRLLQAIDPELQRAAAEDVVDSTLIAAAAVEWRNDGHEFLTYEGPFGVGYSVAVLYQQSVHEPEHARQHDIATPRT